MTEIYRGDIYYIMPFYTVTGSEQRAGRPGVVVSNDINNRHSPNVEIVFLTSQEKERLSTFIKSCTTKELKNIDNALLVSLGINSPFPVGGGGIDENAPQKSTPTEVERDLYKTLYEQILDKLVGGNTND